MVPNHDNPVAELIDLLAELTRIAVRDTARLNDVMEKLEQAYHTSLKTSSETIHPRLQSVFRTLTHCLLQIRCQTDQLLRLARSE